MAFSGGALVVGMGVTGEAVARRLLARDVHVVACDDRPSPAALQAARDLGVPLTVAPTDEQLEALVAAVGVVLPSPGVPAGHPVFALAAARGVPVWSEFELAARWSDLPVVAITGTNGKTTVTTLVTAMLTTAGFATVAAGNTDTPLVDVLDLGLDMVVVEASSFRLQYTMSFRPSVGTWLNLAQDHLDWHPSMEEYIDAKARIWANQRPEDVAVANIGDPVVAAAARTVRSTVRWFGIDGPVEGGWWWDRQGGRLMAPDGPLIDVADLRRRLPHDLANALAAAATATAAGAPPAACAEVLASFEGLAHRVALVGEAGGVRWYDDSKATTPASVLAAVGGFDSVVLIAGGRNKGLDLAVLAATAPPVRAVVAIGDSAAEVCAAFSTTGVPVVTAASMDEAVRAAAHAARPGDAVLLSPGCASFDWYRDFIERGDDFARLVVEVTGAQPVPRLPGGH